MPAAKKVKFNHQFDPSYKGSSGEINNLPSETVPDQSLSIRQLIQNHTRGIHSDVKHYEGEYFEDQIIPNFEDLTDVVQYKENLVQRQKDIENEIKLKQEAVKAEKQKQVPPVPKTEKVPETAHKEPLAD